MCEHKLIWASRTNDENSRAFFSRFFSPSFNFRLEGCSYCYSSTHLLRPIKRGFAMKLLINWKIVDKNGTHLSRDVSCYSELMFSISHLNLASGSWANDPLKFIPAILQRD